MIAAVDLIILGCVVAATTIFPVLVLRKGRLQWGIAEALFWISMTLGLTTLRLIGADLPGPFLFGVVFVVRTAMFVGLVLLSDETAFRWSAVRAGIASTFIYLLLIPHVLQVPIDGDEPFFLLVTESIVKDMDLDLANQYEALESSEAGRLDLEPQLGDPVGEQGQIYSRHEPFLSVLLIPGYLIGGLYGGVATIALLGGLLVWSLLRLVEERGHPGAARSLIWPALALAPPVLFYATRLWAEVPGALAFSEAIRAMHARRWGRFVAWLLVLSLLQLRFGMLAAGLLLAAVVTNRPPWKRIAIGLLVLGVPFVVLWISTGSPFGVHHAFEVLPMNPTDYVRGLVGLIVDAQAGMLFQAPFWLLSLLVFFRQEDRESVALLWIAAVPYLILLAPRAEWYGGWSPPLRYLVVFAPIVALSLARVVKWLPPHVTILAGAWTAGVMIHGIAFPWRLFHIASGESVLAAALSSSYGIDFSRLFPSLIRFNVAAVFWFALVVVVGVLLSRFRERISAAAVAIVMFVAIGAVSVVARAPGHVVELEDAWVERQGGELYPERWTVARFRFRGGWSLPEGASARFRIEPGPAVIDYASADGAVIDLDGQLWSLPPTDGFGRAVVAIENETVELKIVHGAVVIDRVIHE